MAAEKNRERINSNQANPTPIPIPILVIPIPILMPAGCSQRGGCCCCRCSAAGADFAERARARALTVDVRPKPSRLACEVGRRGSLLSTLFLGCPLAGRRARSRHWAAASEEEWRLALIRAEQIFLPNFLPLCRHSGCLRLLCWQREEP